MRRPVSQLVVRSAWGVSCAVCGAWTAFALSTLAAVTASITDAALGPLAVAAALLGAAYGVGAAPRRARELGARRAVAVALAGPLAGATYGALLAGFSLFALLRPMSPIGLVGRMLFLTMPLLCVLGGTLAGAVWAARSGRRPAAWGHPSR